MGGGNRSPGINGYTIAWTEGGTGTGDGRSWSVTAPDLATALTLYDDHPDGGYATALLLAFVTDPRHCGMIEAARMVEGSGFHMESMGALTTVLSRAPVTLHHPAPDGGHQRIITITLRDDLPGWWYHTGDRHIPLGADAETIMAVLSKPSNEPLLFRLARARLVHEPGDAAEVFTAMARCPSARRYAYMLVSEWFDELLEDPLTGLFPVGDPDDPDTYDMLEWRA